MKTHSRLKKFNGLPHELSGLDYTYDSEVEGGEVSYTPKGAQHEFIFRKDSSNIKELQKQDKLRSKREEGDRISDISFDAIAKELMLKESQQLASEGIDPFNEQNTYATGGTRLRYTSDGTLSQDAPTPTMEQMNTGEVVGWTILDTLLGDLMGMTHFTGRSPSEMWSGKGTKKPEPGKFKADDHAPVTAGTVAGVYQSQYQIPVGNKVVQQIPIAGEFAKMADQSRSMVQPKMDDDAKKQGINMYEGGLYTPSTGGTPNFNFGNTMRNASTPNTDYAGLDSDFMYDNPQSTPTDQTDLTGDQPINIPRIVDNYSFKNGGMRKKYAGTNGSTRSLSGDPTKDPFENAYSQYMDYMTTGNLEDDFPNMLPEAVVDGNGSYSGVNEPIDQDTPYIPKKDMDNPVLYSKTSDYTTVPQDTPTQKNEFKFDPNMLASIAGGLGQMIPSIAYLAGDGKDYDKVRYPMYNPELLDATLPLRESRDTFGSSLEALRQRGQLDLGALSELATQGAKSSSGVRQNIANANTSIKNQAQLQNIGTLIQQFTDEAANKGNYQTQKYNAMQKLADTLAYTTRQGNMKERDKLLKSEIDNMVSAKFTELFGE